MRMRKYEDEKNPEFEIILSVFLKHTEKWILVTVHQLFSLNPQCVCDP